MATKPLRSLTFPGLSDTYTVAVTDPTLALSGEPADAKATGDALASKADPNGSYEGLTAGSAEQLLSTTGAEDRTPYMLRQTGGGVSVGDRAEETIVGGSVCWNQLVNLNAASGTTAGVTYTNNQDGSFLLTGVSTGSTRRTLGEVRSTGGHVLFLYPGTSKPDLYGQNKVYTVLLYGSDAGSQHFLYAVDGELFRPSRNWSTIRCICTTGIDLGDGMLLRPQVFDLTKMFGSAVADAVYAMNQASAGAGVAWFRAMFPESYYPYNAGVLMSVQTSGKTATSADGTVVKTYPLDSSLILRGVPRWDSVKGTMYYDGDEYTSDGRVKWRYGIVDLGTLTWQKDAVNGRYWTTGALPNAKGGNNGFVQSPYYYNLTDCTGNYASDSVDLALGVYGANKKIVLINKTEYSAGTTGTDLKPKLSGIMLVYELATPATDPAAPFQSPQWVESGGTEAFIDAGTETGRVAVPVGHDTFYPTDLRGGLETLLSPEVTVTGTTATITAERDRRYLCGTMDALTFTPCASGLCEVRFTSGTTPTALTLPQTVKMPDWWNGVEANYTYEISIADGVYGAVMAWAT